MRIYFPIAKVDADRHEVWGYASTEARDDQGEIVKREALTAALGDYMKFANIREMHQLSAVGIAKEAGIDEKGLYIGAKIVDEQAWLKIVEGVYKGYSIGGRVTQRDSADYKTITGLVLNEISLVDRPANPEAVFDYWKAAGGPAMSETRFNPPLQIWACGEPQHRHITKADSLKCLEKRDPASGVDDGADLIGAARKAIAQAEEVLAIAPGTDDAAPIGEVEYADPGDQPDGKKRYPIDTESHKAKYAHHALFDLACQTIDKCLEIEEVSAEDATHMQAARDALKKAADEMSEDPHFAFADRSEATPGRSDLGHWGGNTIIYASKTLIDTIVTALARRNGAHQALIDVAHDCIGSLTAGAFCSPSVGGARHSKATMANLAEAHYRLVSAGAGCSAKSEAPDDFKETVRNTPYNPGKAAGPDDIVKALADERAEKTALMTALANVLPRLDRLTKRVEDIAQMPLPAATIAKGAIAISKLQDNDGFDNAITPDSLAAAFARMSREEQTLTLIKASYARPIHPPGFGIAPRGE